MKWRSFAILSRLFSGLFFLVASCMILAVSSLSLSGCNSIDKRTEAVPKKPLPELSATTSKPKMVWSSHHGTGDVKNDVKLRLALTSEYLISADRKGNLFAQDQKTGVLKWQVDTKAHLSGGPTVVQSLVLVGTREGRLLAYRSHDGQFCWEAPLSGEVLAAPTAYQGIAYVKTQDGTVTAVKLEDGKVLWRHSLHTPFVVLRQSSSPVITPNHVLVGFPNGRLVALHRSSGITDWERDIASPKGRSDIQRMNDISADPLVINGTAYVVSFQGRLVALSEQDGQSRWEQEMSSYSGLEHAGKTLFISDASGDVWALDKSTGKTLWKQSWLQGRRLSKPVAFGASIVIGDNEGNLHWLSQKDGSYLNRVVVDGKGIEAPPEVKDNLLYVLGRGGKIAVFGQGTLAINPELVPSQ